METAWCLSESRSMRLMADGMAFGSVSGPYSRRMLRSAVSVALKPKMAEISEAVRIVCGAFVVMMRTPVQHGDVVYCKSE